MSIKIHIKKSNRGKFTDYCGGKVTSECIQRGKNSPNPAIRKRATFAANARKWKHEKGGAFVKGVNVLDSNPKAYKQVKKRYKMHQAGGSFDWGGLAQTAVNAISQIKSNSIRNKAIDQQIEANKERLKAEKERNKYFADQTADHITREWADQQQKDFNSGTGGQNVSDIVTSNMKYNIASSLINPNIDQKYKQAELELQQYKQDNTNNMISNIGNNVLGFMMNQFGNSKNTPPSITTDGLQKNADQVLGQIKQQQQQNLFSLGNNYLQNKYSTR